MTARCLVINTDDTYQWRELPTGYPDFKDAFLTTGGDCWLEALYGPNGITFWFDEEGKLKGLPINRIGTLLYHLAGGAPLMVGDVLVGVVAISGSDGHGEIADCPDISEALETLNQAVGRSLERTTDG